jgi:hypothetical protein
MAMAAVLFASGRGLLLILVADGGQLAEPAEGRWADPFDGDEIVERTERTVRRAIRDNTGREHVADARQPRQLGYVRGVDVDLARCDERRGDNDHVGNVDWAHPRRLSVPRPRPQQDDAADEEPRAHQKHESSLLLVRHDTSMATRSLSYLLLSEKTNSVRADLEY